MAQPTYPAARAVAGPVSTHFARHIAAASAREGTAIIEAPGPDIVEAMIDAGFWASLRREEGQTPRISLAFLPPARARHALVFETHLPLGPAMLAKVAPAVERPGIHLGVWRSGDGLHVWGTTRDIPAFCLVVEVVNSGLLVVKHRSEPFGKFVNVAVLEGDQIKIVDERGGKVVPDCPALVTSLIGSIDRPISAGVNAVLVQLAASMRLHGRGGALLVVPSGSDKWRDSVVRPLPYALNPPFSELADLMHGPPPDSDDLKRAVDAIAGLTAVDGATIMNDGYEVLAFGAKITRLRGSTPVDTINVTEPVEGNLATRASPSQIGGTRHLSAAQFIFDQRDATALVASQDGRFTIFRWSPSEQFVHAHRVDALLL